MIGFADLLRFHANKTDPLNGDNDANLKLRKNAF